MTYVPRSTFDAIARLQEVAGKPLAALPRTAFVRAWSSLAYLYPGMHPDNDEAEVSDWPPVVRDFVTEACRRAGRNMLADEELYPSDATWAGVYDAMRSHTPEEENRRERLSRKGRI